MWCDVVEVKPVEHLKLFVRFSDGLTGEVHIKPSHLYGVFAVLKASAVFNQVNCKEGFVSWPGEIDLAPDAMYDAIKLNGRWVLR